MRTDEKSVIESQVMDVSPLLFPALSVSHALFPCHVLKKLETMCSHPPLFQRLKKTSSWLVKFGCFRLSWDVPEIQMIVEEDEKTAKTM